MDKKLIYQTTAIAALVALVSVFIQIVGGSSMPAGVPAQPYGVSIEDFVSGIDNAPQTVLLFFAGDSAFPLSYLLVFVGLYVLTSERARPFALVGLAIGALTALFDSAENAYFISYALQSYNGVTVPEPDISTIYMLTTLKWTAAFGTLYAFGLIFPRGTLLERGIMVLMLAFPVFGIAGLVQPSLIAFRGLFFLVGMPLFAWYFWQKAKAV